MAPSGRPAKSWEVAARPTKEQPSFIPSFIHLRRGTVHEAILKSPVNKPAKKMSINSRNMSPIYIPGPVRTGCSLKASLGFPFRSSLASQKHP